MNDDDRLRILYVDDNENDHVLFRRAIEKTCPGCGIVEANDPSDAFGKLASGYLPHVIITDGSFHSADGLTFIQQLRGYFPSIPVIALSGRNDQFTINRAYESGASAYLVKPVEFTTYLEMIRVLTRFLEQSALPDVNTASGTNSPGLG
jgi:CheY-like chemotaxis protein